VIAGEVAASRLLTLAGEECTVIEGDYELGTTGDLVG
jgi:hypothetical protein